MIKKIAIVPNLSKNNALAHTENMVAILNENNITALVEKQYAEKVKGCVSANYDDICSADMIVTLGGDGTLLSAVHKYNDADCAFLGINHGHLGFLTEIEKGSYDEFIKVLKGNYQVTEHLTIDTMVGGKTYTSLNDTTVHRKAVSGMIKFTVSVDGELLYTASADGIIVSTPTGSTAYSLSAGGPIVDPTVDVVILSLICPHNLNSRSILVPKLKRIEINILEATEGAVVNFDGNMAVPVNVGETLTVTSGKKIKLVRTSKNSFYKRLKEKLF